MTDEERERTMNFILNNQAQFTVDMQKLKEAQAHIESNFEHLIDKVDKLADAQIKSESRITRLEESFVTLVQLSQSTYERIDTLTEAQTNTDITLNKFINVLERYISEGRKGSSTT